MEPGLGEKMLFAGTAACTADIVSFPLDVIIFFIIIILFIIIITNFEFIMQLLFFLFLLFLQIINYSDFIYLFLQKKKIL